MPHYNFRQDFNVAKKTEAQIADFMTQVDNINVINWCNNKDYDFLAVKPDKQTKIAIEVKEDFTCKRTGNVGVEFESWGRKSGIETTKADFYVWKVHAPDNTIRVYEMSVADLRKHIADGQYFRIVVGGDVGSESRNYLFKLDFIEKNSRLVGYLTE